VANHLQFSSDSHMWIVSFIRVAHDWEVDCFSSFFNLLYSIRLRLGVEDKLCWTPSKIGLFEVRSFYNVLIPHNSAPFSWRSTQWSKIPLRVAFFVWLAALRKILTMDNLRRRNL
jgi:hypothetical protein